MSDVDTVAGIVPLSMKRRKPEYDLDHVFLELFSSLWESFPLSPDMAFVTHDDSIELGLAADQVLLVDGAVQEDIARIQNEIGGYSPAEYLFIRPEADSAVLQEKVLEHLRFSFAGERFARLSAGHKESMRNLAQRLRTPESAEQTLFSVCLSAYNDYLEQIFDRATHGPPAGQTALGELFPSRDHYDGFIEKLQALGWVDKNFHWAKSSKKYITHIVFFLANEEILKTDTILTISEALVKTFVTGRKAGDIRKPRKGSKEYRTVVENFSFLLDHRKQRG